MSSEYIRINSAEGVYGEKSLLQAQLSIVLTTKSLQAYYKLRKEEISLQIIFKKLLEEAIQSIAVLEKILPKVAMREVEEKKSHEDIQMMKEKEASISIDQELEKIKEKLLRLQGR